MFEKILAAFRSLFQPDMTTAERAAALDKRAHELDPRGGLEWRAAVVDLLKVLDLDSSKEARRQLAAELGYALKFTGSKKNNLWLHQRVLAEVARHGIKIP